MAAAILPSVAFLGGNTLGAFVLVDRYGRRPLLVGGMAGMAMALLMAGLVTMRSGGGGGAGGVAISCVVMFMACFGVSWGYGAWLYIAEIMPLRARGKGVGLCTFINWGPANLASAFLTPWMLQRSVLGSGGTLLFFGAVATATVPFALLCMPETRGQTLEDIQPMFAFRGAVGLRRFARGNLAHGGGARGPDPRAPASDAVELAAPPAVALTRIEEESPNSRGSCDW